MNFDINDLTLIGLGSDIEAATLFINMKGWQFAILVENVSNLAINTGRRTLFEDSIE